MGRGWAAWALLGALLLAWPGAARAYQPTASEVAQLIVDRWNEGYQLTFIAGFVGASLSTVSRIVSRHRAGEPLVAPRGPGSRGAYRSRTWNEPRQEWLLNRLAEDPDLGAPALPALPAPVARRVPPRPSAAEPAPGAAVARRGSGGGRAAWSGAPPPCRRPVGVRRVRVPGVRRGGGRELGVAHPGRERVDPEEGARAAAARLWLGAGLAWPTHGAPRTQIVNESKERNYMQRENYRLHVSLNGYTPEQFAWADEVSSVRPGRPFSRRPSVTAQPPVRNLAPGLPRAAAPPRARCPGSFPASVPHSRHLAGPRASCPHCPTPFPFLWASSKPGAARGAAGQEELHPLLRLRPQGRALREGARVSAGRAHQHLHGVLQHGRQRLVRARDAPHCSGNQRAASCSPQAPPPRHHPPTPPPPAPPPPALSTARASTA